MLVCHCKKLSDRDLREIVRAGACSRGQVTRRCGAGGECGGCLPAIEVILAQELPPERALSALEHVAAR